MTRLKPNQRQFVDLVARGTNATDAMRIVAPHLTDASARQRAYLWKKDPRIAQAIEERVQQYFDEAAVRREQILLRIVDIARLDVRKLCKPDGTPKKLHELDEDTARILEGIECSPDGTILKFRAPKRLEAERLLGAHAKLWTQNVHHSGSVTLAELVTQSMEPEAPADPETPAE